MKREELIAYDKWLTRRKWGTGEIISPEKAADLYLAEHPLPPAEGAEKSCLSCRFHNSPTYHDKMWCRDCQQLSHYEQQPTAEGAEQIASDLSLTIGLLEAEIDSLKDAYKSDGLNSREYSSAILSHKTALKILKGNISQKPPQPTAEGAELDHQHDHLLDHPEGAEEFLKSKGYAEAIKHPTDGIIAPTFTWSHVIELLQEYVIMQKPQPTAEGAEEILPTDKDIAIEIVARFTANPHPNQRANYEREKKAFANGAIYVREIAQRFITLHARKMAEEIVKEQIPSNQQIHEAALAWAKEHSEAPDKDCPDWLIRDYEAGAYFVRQCMGCWNKE